jgi:N-acetylmuramoyl-L-alanine amidase
MSDITVALDAGHGGSDPGATYKGRNEKDDTLRLVKAIGKILEQNGINVYYVRTDDEYETPYKKAMDANNAGAKYFISIHRNSSEKDNQYNGIETLVYDDSGIKATMARNINAELEKVGFNNLGVDERPNLVVLKRTKMPADLVEVGFINSDEDNAIFDKNFNKIAQGIADGILKTIKSSAVKASAEVFNKEKTDDNMDRMDQMDDMDRMNDRDRMDRMNDMDRMDRMDNDNMYVPSCPNGDCDGFDNPLLQYRDDDARYQRNDYMPQYMNAESMANYTTMEEPQDMLYRVQVGAYKNRENADRMLNELLMEGFPAFIIIADGYYKVQVGAYRYLANAIKMEQRLRRFQYCTYIAYS